MSSTGGHFKRTLFVLILKIIPCYKVLVWCLVKHFLPGFSLSKWMIEQGMTYDGSLSTSLSDTLFKKLGIDSFLKNPACDRTESPYNVNKIPQSGWSSGNYSTEILKKLLFNVHQLRTVKDNYVLVFLPVAQWTYILTWKNTYPSS